jgi:hypothetical protein
MRTFLLFLFIAPAICFAQVTTDKFTGNWQVSNQKDPQSYFRFEGGQVQMFVYSTDKKKFLPKKQSVTTDIVETSSINKNNALYSWTNTCAKCGWTETQIYTFLRITDNLIRVSWVRYVNNLDATKQPEESFDTEDAVSFMKSESYDYVPLMERYTATPQVGAASSKFITISSVEVNGKNTVVSFSLKNSAYAEQSFTLHPPGSEKAFVLIDDKGNRYKMTGQYGFGGYRTLILDEDDDLEFKIYFEKIPAGAKTLTIKEGDCTGDGCWNFYDVKL